MRKWYEYGDRLKEELLQKIDKEFKRSRLTLDFDGLNVMKAKSVTTKLYDRLDKMNRKYMLAVADNAFREAQKDAAPDKKQAKLPAKWLAALLLAYDPVTKYVYEHEVERKRARLFEAVVADRQAESRIGIIQDYKTARSAWRRQSSQYMIAVEDAAVLQGYEKAGVKRVMWRSEHDDKTCDTCLKRDGLIFLIRDVPDKPHYGCRCTLEPIMEKDGGD